MAAGFATLIGYITPNGKFKGVNLYGECDTYGSCWTDTENGINIKPTLKQYRQLQRVKNLVSGGSIIHVGSTPSNTVYYKDCDHKKVAWGHDLKYSDTAPVLYDDFETATEYAKYVYCFDPDIKDWIFYEDGDIVDEDGYIVSEFAEYDDSGIRKYKQGTSDPYVQDIYGESTKTQSSKIKLRISESLGDLIPADKVKIGDYINGHEKGLLTVKKVKVDKIGKRIIKVVITVTGQNGTEDIEYRNYGGDIEQVEII